VSAAGCKVSLRDIEELLFEFGVVVADAPKEVS
jgi:hypothetical protein